MPKRLTTKEWLIKAKEIRGNKYNYLKVNYVNAHKKVIIICKKHGEFLQTPDHHLQGQNCFKCTGSKKKTTEEFILKSEEVHDNKYNYSRVEYINNHSKVEIICKEHGSFWQTPKAHLKGFNCFKCAHNKIGNLKRLTTEECIKRAKFVHNNKYNYSKTKYTNNYTKVEIICKKHGSFWQTPNSHQQGCGCPNCKAEKLSELFKSNTKEFIIKAKLIHGRYDYSKVNYINAVSKVEIICPQHGSFWQTPTNHTHKNLKQGCPKCSHHISSQEIKLYNFLKKVLPNTEIIQSDRIILKPKELDIYIPKYNLAIEVNGAYWHSEEFKRKDYHKNKTRDCKKQGITLLHFWDYEINDNFKKVSYTIRNTIYSM